MAAKKQQPKPLTAKEASERFGIPVRTARDWMAAGMPLVPGPTQDEWVNHRQTTGKNRPKGMLAGVTNEKILSLAEQKIEWEIKRHQVKYERDKVALGRDRGKLISLVDAQQSYGQFVSMLNTRMRSIGRSVCDFLLYLEDPREAERIVQDEINRALDVLSNDDGTILPQPVQKTRRTRKSNRKPVGRKKPRLD